MVSILLRQLCSNSKNTLKLSSSQWIYRSFSSASASSTSSSLSVKIKNRIDEKRQQSLLGGGLKRIEQQHKKVIFCDFTTTKKIDF